MRQRSECCLFLLWWLYGHGYIGQVYLCHAMRDHARNRPLSVAGVCIDCAYRIQQQADMKTQRCGIQRRIQYAIVGSKTADKQAFYASQA